MSDKHVDENAPKLTKRERLEKEQKAIRDKLNILARQDAVKTRKIRDRAKYVAGGIFINLLARKVVHERIDIRGAIKEACDSVGINVDTVEHLEVLIGLIQAEAVKQKKELERRLPS